MKLEICMFLFFPLVSFHECSTLFPVVRTLTSLSNSNVLEYVNLQKVTIYSAVDVWRSFLPFL
jgi:hypothetical protein